MTKLKTPFIQAFLLLVTTCTILVHTQTALAAKPIQTSVPPAPKLAADNYLLWDANSGFVLAEQNIDERINPASITKIMTSYVVAAELASNSIALDDDVLVSEKAYKSGGSRMFIEVNKRVKVSDLLKGLVIQSGNDAAVALAEYVAGSESSFADLMNQYAVQLGMTNTNYTNSTGFTAEGHYTTARDIALLSKALIRDYPDHYSLYKQKEFEFNGIKQKNRNNLLWRDDAIDGIKTGHTEAAGYCLAASAEKNGMRLISVVLGTDSANARINQSQSLLNYGFRFYESQTIYTPNTKILEQKIWKAEQENIDLVVKAPVTITFPRGRYNDLTISSNIPKQLVAPIGNEALGTVEISLDGKTLVSTPLFAAQAVEEAGIFKRMMDSIKMKFDK